MAPNRRSQLRQLGKHAVLRFGVLVALVGIASVWSSALFEWTVREAALTLSILLAFEPLYDVAVLLQVDRKQRAELPFLPPEPASGTGETRSAASIDRAPAEPAPESSASDTAQEPAVASQDRQAVREDVVEDIVEESERVDKRVPATQQADDEDVRAAVRAVEEDPHDAVAGEVAAPAPADGDSPAQEGGTAAILDLDDGGPEPEAEWPYIIEEPFHRDEPIVRESDHTVQEVFQVQQRTGTERAATEFDIPVAAVEEVLAYAEAHPETVTEAVTA